MEEGLDLSLLVLPIPSTSTVVLPLFRKLVLITLALMAAMISPHPCCPSVVLVQALVQALVGVEVMVGDYQFVWLPNDSVWEEGGEVEEV